MGTYVSAVHKSKGFAAFFQNKFIRIYPVIFFCKIQDLTPTWDRTRSNFLHARLEHMSQAWKNSGPEYVINSDDSPKDGDAVYKVSINFRSYADCNKFPGELVGFLKRNNKKWIVETVNN